MDMNVNLLDIIFLGMLIFILIPFMIKQYRYSINFMLECEYDKYKDALYKELTTDPVNYTLDQYSVWMKVFGGEGRLKFKSKKEFNQAMIKVQKEFTFIEWVKQDLRKNKLDNILQWKL